MTAPIKPPYDHTILAMAAEGATMREIAIATGKMISSVRRRSSALGVSSQLMANLHLRQRARLEAGGRDACKLFGYQGSAYAAAAMPPTRVDRTASDLLHTLRAVRRRADPSAPIPGSFIACVFDAGLTLDEIDATYAVPPVEAVAAIRHHHGIRL